MVHVIVRDTSAAPLVAGPDIYRYRWSITGGQVGTGFINFYADASLPAQPFVTATAALLNGAWATGASGGLPSGITLTPDAICDVITAATGKLNGSSGITPPSVITGGNSSVYAAPGGFALTWTTGAIVNGKRLKGRTFFVPVSSAKFQTDGTLDNVYVSAIRAAAATYAGGSWFPCVWHRPVGGTGGSAAVMNGYTLNDKVAILTSRR